MNYYKIVNSNDAPIQRGRKPSQFRTKVDKTLAVMDPKSSFTVWKKANMTNEQLQKTLSAYVCFYQEKTWSSKRFSTKKYKHGVKVTREK